MRSLALWYDGIDTCKRIRRESVPVHIELQLINAMEKNPDAIAVWVGCYKMTIKNYSK